MMFLFIALTGKSQEMMTVLKSNHWKKQTLISSGLIDNNYEMGKSSDFLNYAFFMVHPIRAVCARREKYKRMLYILCVYSMTSILIKIKKGGLKRFG